MKYPLLEELNKLVKSRVAGIYGGMATADGDVGGTTLIDGGTPTGAGANSFVGMTLIIAPNSILTVDSAEITAFNTVTGQFTLNKAYKEGQIVTGTQYYIVTDRLGLSTLNNIWTIVNALLVLTETGGTYTTTGAVENIYVNNAPAGIFRPVCVKVDLTNQAGGDTYIIQTSYRIIDGGNLIVQDTQTLAGVQDPALINIDLEPNRFGIQVTGEHTVVAAAFDIDWEVCYEV